jgi:glycosyltransferase involved in cell wall biosynthesis
MRAHIVRPTDGWSLQRLAESITLPGGSIGPAPDPTADVNLYVNYYLWSGPSGSRDVGFFTHRHGEDNTYLRDRFDEVARGVHACVAMCGQTARHLPRKPTLVWRGAADPIFRRPPLVLGVVARPSARKRLHWISEIERRFRVEVRHTGGGLPLGDMPDFYRRLDYLLITADMEGGPIPVQEALAMGTPVIAPDVGYAWDYPVLRYDGTFEGLAKVLAALTPPTDAWARESEKLWAFLARVCRDTPP